MNLYEVDSQYKELQAIIEDNGGELTEELEAQFDSICADRTTKISNYIRLVRNLNSNLEQVTNEIDRLKGIYCTMSNKVDWLKRNLSTTIGEGNSYQLPEGSISWRKSESTVINDELLIPAKYVTIKEVKSISKTDIKAAIKRGLDIPGAELQTKQHMQIK